MNNVLNVAAARKPRKLRGKRKQTRTVTTTTNRGPTQRGDYMLAADVCERGKAKITKLAARIGVVI